MILKTEIKVYRQFFTNGAVAWFSAGVIAPLFARTIGIKEVSASLISVVSCLIFLRWATILAKEER